MSMGGLDYAMKQVGGCDTWGTREILSDISQVCQWLGRINCTDVIEWEIILLNSRMKQKLTSMMNQ